MSRHKTWVGGKPKGPTAPKDRLLCGGFEGESPQHMGRFFQCYYLHDDRRQSHQLTDNVQQIKLLKLVQFSFIPKIISIQNEPMMPTLLQSRFKRSQNIHNTRSRNTFIVRYSRTNLKAMCISVWGARLWNALPVYIKEIRSLYIFKIKAKAYLLSYYNI